MKASREPCFARPAQLKTMLSAIFLLCGLWSKRLTAEINGDRSGVAEVSFTVWIGFKAFVVDVRLNGFQP